MIDILNNIPAVLWFVVGFVFGFFVMAYRCLGRKDGSIYVTKGEDEQPDKYLFEFNIPPEEIPEKKQVVFWVKIEKGHS